MQKSICFGVKEACTHWPLDTDFGHIYLNLL